MGPLGIGVVGLGYMGKLHLAAYRSLPDEVTVRAVAEPDREKLGAVELEGATPYRNFDDLCTDSEVHAVSICLPTAAHYPAAVKALRAGKHVLVEKPAACSVEQVEDMCRLAREQKRILMVGMTHRFYPEFAIAREILDSGGVGTPVFCRDSIVEFLGMLKLPPWYLDSRQACGGVVMTSGIHLVDRILWLLRASVQDVEGYFRSSLLGSSVEDEAMMWLMLSNSVAAQIVFAWVPYPHPLVCRLEIYGTQGSLEVETWHGVTWITPQGRKTWDCYPPEMGHVEKVQKGVNAEVSEFARAIRENRTPLASGEETLAAFRVVRNFLDRTSGGKSGSS